MPQKILALLIVAGFAEAKRADLVEPQRYIDHVRFLASPKLQGRGAGTSGLKQASEYIAARFREAGLRPAGEKGSFFQSLEVTTSAKPGKNNELRTRTASLDLNKDYLPLSFSSNGQVAGPIVFAGYGITAPEFHYDDYQHLDVKNKVVLILRYEPPHFRANRPGGQDAHTHHSQLVAKAINAKNHGATAVILVNGAAPEGDKLIKFGSVSGPDNAGILVLQATNAAVERWLAGAGKSLAQLQTQINSTRRPESVALTALGATRVRVDIHREQSTVHNVVGFRPGVTDEYVVIGAHYDHLGLGNESSLAPSQIGQIHPGADDNASGTAGLLELARTVGAGKTPLRRGVLFIAFAGEEIGLLGSSQWVNHPTRPLEHATAMINMDMIGRLNGSKLYIGGVGTGSTFEPILKDAIEQYSLQADYSQDGYSASDHTSFASKSIPVLFFFSGLHGDYHKPSDTWEKINSKASAEVVNLIHEVATELATQPERPKFGKVQPSPHSGSPAGISSGSGYGPYFGSIPDFAPVDKGVKFSDVRPGSPAAKAGLQAGDILIGYGEKPIDNLYDFTFALRNSKVGDVVKVKFVRGAREMSADVKLEARQ